MPATQMEFVPIRLSQFGNSMKIMYQTQNQFFMLNHANFLCYFIQKYGNFSYHFIQKYGNV